MATQKEQALLNEIIDLAHGVNEAGQVDARVEVWSGGVQIRMSDKPFDSTNDWVYYPDRAAYFSGEVFSEADFEYVAGTYITELKKHHPQYDADGVRV
ncbi:hypothetical protein D3C80_1799590 [compost metagenome]